jgi:hypothetical protein
MTDRGPVITVDAPIAADAPAPGASVAPRIAAGVAGIVVLLLGALISLGGALIGALGVLFASLVAKRRRLPLSRLMAWVGAVATTAVAILIAGSVFFTTMPEGTFAEFMSTVDSVQKAQAPPPGVSQESADSLRIALQEDRAVQTGMVIGGVIGGYIALMFLSAFYGSIGWVGALLLVFAFTGRWLGRSTRKSAPSPSAPPAPRPVSPSIG